LATFWEINLKSAELNKKNNIFELNISELEKSISLAAFACNIGAYDIDKQAY